LVLLLRYNDLFSVLRQHNLDLDCRVVGFSTSHKTSRTIVNE